MPFEAGHIYWITFGFIQPPHEKISLCVCPDRPLFFWISSKAKSHGIGQVGVSAQICSTLKYDSYLDLSGVKTGSEADLASARHVGPISEDLKRLIVASLNIPIKLLPDAYRLLALANIR